MAIKRQPVNFKKNYFEANAWKNNNIICGIDEVGRGCLAGPVVAAAVILPQNQAPLFLKDSKIMTPEAREKAFNWIIKECFYSVGIINNRMIDKYNIHQSSLFAMKKAIINLLTICPKKPSDIVVDAMPLHLDDSYYKDIPVHYFIKGESKSSSIAAASIVAKVFRDNLMQQFNSIFPGYLLHSHKGYATPLHREKIQKHMPSLIHRNSFLKTIHFQSKDAEYAKQQSLC